MKAKNILMTLLLVTGAIAAKAAGYPPELALVSQPVIKYNNSSITVYYDVENIGDYTYRGYVSLYLDPDYGYSYADKWVKVRPGAIKRIAINIPLRRIDTRHTFTIMPYYELGDDLYSFTTFEYFDPIRFYWDGPRNEHWVVIKVGPCPSYYHRPCTYRFYYDGFRPPMPPPGHAHGTPPPTMNPMHHTYSYHSSNGGYPATHPEWNDKPEPKPENPAPTATVRPNENAGSMCNSVTNGTSTGSSSGTSNARPSSNDRPANGSASSSGRTPSGNSSNLSRPSSNNSDNARPANNGNSSSSSRPANSTNSNGSVSRPSGTSTGSASSSGRTPSGNSSNLSRPSNNNSGNARPANNGNSSSNRNSGSSSSSTARPSSSTTRPAGTTSGNSARSSSSSSNSRSSSSSRR